VCPISTLAQWTDVLHLSTKWNFSAVRAAAIHAILPLSSPVDRVVIGRAYNVGGWLVDAFSDILMREDDLSEEEDARMSRGDLRAIAKGQRQLARMAETPSGAEVRKMVFELFPGQFVSEWANDIPMSMPAFDISPATNNETTYSPANSDAVSILSSASDTTHIGEASPEEGGNDLDESNIRRWIEQIVELKRHEQYPARACLIKFTAGDPGHLETVLDILLEMGHKEYASTEDRFLPMKNSMFLIIFILLKSKWTAEPPFEELVRAAGLRLLKNWNALVTHSLDHYPSNLTVAPAIRDVIATTRYVRYLVDKSVLPHSIFIVFWEQLLALLQLATASKNEAVRPADIVNSVLVETSSFVYTNAACLEIDAFYQAVEHECQAARGGSRWETAQVFRVSAFHIMW
jgi:hypothetical protein